MSKRLGQGRTLRKIERELARSDPRLNALFLSVTGLGRGKAMPDAEMIRTRPGWLPLRLGRRPDRHQAGADGRARPGTIR